MSVVTARAQLKLPASYSTVYPLRVSPDGRSILRADNRPFQMTGDAGNSISVMANHGEVIQYLQDRQSRGVNAVWLSMIEHRFSDNSPAWRNVWGDLPFTGTISGEVDFTTPNAPYWAYMDWIINRAYDFEICFLATPAYLGFGMGVEGFASAINLNGTANMTTYGSFIGNRYKSFPNIIWVMGGDSAPGSPTNLTTHVNNMANAIKAADTVHLMTAHPGPNTSAFDSYNQTWLDINVSYTDQTNKVHQRTRLARQQATKPVFLFEAEYGNEHSMTDALLRLQLYHGSLGGGVGAVYGQDPQWYFGSNSGVSCNSSGFPDTTGVNYHTSMGNFGGSYLVYHARLLAARDLSDMTPDYAHTAVTANYDSGAAEGLTYCPFMASTRKLVGYVTGGQTPTVAKTQFVSKTFNVNWYNVRDGSVTSGGTSSFGSGSQTFTPPDSNDWVLLADDQTLFLQNP